MSSPWTRIEQSVLFLLKHFLLLLKTSALSVVLNIMVDKGIILSCGVVVVVIRK